MKRAPNTPINTRLETSRRRIARVLAAIYVLTQFTPYAQVLASPQHFSRPGAGVSRLPLGVMAFDAPGFGDVSDAINVANGNVYLGLDQLSRNNVMGAARMGAARLATGNGRSRRRSGCLVMRALDRKSVV